MTFLTLQDRLREHIRARIRRRELTGIGLARAAGFPQGHISNFLNFRRGLSLDSMDRLLQTLGIGVVDLVGSREIHRRAGVAGSQNDSEQVPLISFQDAKEARFATAQVLEWRSFSERFLRRLRPSEFHHRQDWHRFVLIKLDTEKAREAFSSDAAAATVLIDRHYNSLEPYRRAKPNVYLVNFGEGCSAGYLSLIHRNLVLHTRDPHRELLSIHIAAGDSYSQHIIGRVVHVGLEV